MYVLSEPGLLPGCERYILQVPDTFNTLHYYLASCGHYYTLFGYEIKRQYYEYVILCYIVSGELVVETLGRHETVRAGQCVMIYGFPRMSSHKSAYRDGIRRPAPARGTDPPL